MRKVIKKAGVFALTATLVLTGIALPVKGYNGSVNKSGKRASLHVRRDNEKRYSRT